MAIADQLRWWHHRASHNAYGIAEGLQVTRNGEAVTVAPGLAYDCFGRELMVSAPITLPIPLAGEDLTLIVRNSQSLSSAGDRPPNKTPASTAAFPELIWQDSNRVSVRDGVPLARIQRSPAEESEGSEAPEDSEDLEEPADSAILSDYRPRLVRAIARPRIGSGTTIPGATAWKPWRVSDGIRAHLVGFEVAIDTSSAGFNEPPCYFAWLQGPQNVLQGNFLLTALPHIGEESMHHLVFRVWLPAFPVGTLTPTRGVSIRPPLSNQSFEADFLNFAQQQKLYVSWLGIQSLSHHQPEVNHGTAG